jgi:hypothetical protein
MIYTEGNAKYFGFGFVVMYGWAMLTTLLRYKVTDQYSIDTGLVGPTETRVILSLILIAEVLFKDSIIYTAALACILLLVVNIIGSLDLLKQADKRDQVEREAKASEVAERSNGNNK